MSIGDVNSPQRGSGARFNDGKIDLTLLPPWCWEELSHRVDPDNLLRLFYGTELEQLIRFWEGDDDSIELVIDGLDDDDFTGAAKVFAYGAKKYAAWNWAKGMAWSVPLACYLRHMLLSDPESVDVESGMPHRWHAACNLIMLAQFKALCPDMDDRPQEIREEFHMTDLEEEAEGIEVEEHQLPCDVVAACEQAEAILNFEGNRQRIRDRVRRNLAADPDVFEVTYWDDDGNMRIFELGDLPTSALNEVVEQAVEEQESRERTLRATGQLRSNY